MYINESVTRKEVYYLLLVQVGQFQASIRYIDFERDGGVFTSRCVVILEHLKEEVHDILGLE